MSTGYKKITITKLGQIIEGHINYAKSELGVADEQVEKLAKERELICNTCPLKKGNKCNKNNYLLATKDFIYEGQQRFKGQKYNGCGCGLKEKQRCESCSCPIGQW